MDFFNSLSIRIPLAVIGGVFYSLLTYQLVILLDLSSEFSVATTVFVFLFYVGSRFLILFSGIDSSYYSKGRKGISRQFYEGTSFHQTVQWVGKFYHYHDIVLFTFLTISSIVFIITLIIDWTGYKPFGNTVQNFWISLFPLPR